MADIPDWMGVGPSKRKNVPQHIRDEVVRRQGGRCAWDGQYRECNGTLQHGYDIDHIHERQYGGANDPSNYQALCRPCHSIKTRRSGKSFY